MKRPLIKIFKSPPKSVPEAIQKVLLSHFPGAINIDWEQKKVSYEAIFYMNDIEHIARFSHEGILKEYKKNLWPSELPKEIADECNKLGEIMNAIVILRKENRFFEVIIRDPALKRNLLLFNENGDLLDSHKL